MPKVIKRKREEADERKEKHDKLTIKERIVKLDNKFGVGLGATKERKRLDVLQKKESEVRNV